MNNLILEKKSVKQSLDHSVEQLEKTRHDISVDALDRKISELGNYFETLYSLEVDGMKGKFSITVKQKDMDSFEYRVEKRNIDSEIDVYFQNIVHYMNLDGDLQPCADYAYVYEN